MNTKRILFGVFICIAIYSITTIGLKAQTNALIKNLVKPKPFAPIVAKTAESLLEIDTQTNITKQGANIGVYINHNIKGDSLNCSDKMPSFPNLKLSLLNEKELRQRIKNKYVTYVTNRFLNYVQINSQSVDTVDMNVFPITCGQKKMAEYLEHELRTICKDDNVVITRSDNQYVYVKLPSNISRGNAPSLMFMAHLDVTPEVPTSNITPIVHNNYNGGDIKLPSGIVLSPQNPQGSHLNNCKGKTIVTSDGSTLLGADDKSGVTVLVSLLERIVRNKKISHGDIYFVFSQNEDIGRAADRFESKYVDGNPDIIIDVDGSMPDRFSVENFTASMFTYHFKGHGTHPGDGFINKYGDALTAASYFIGKMPPSKHPSASKDKQGYIHCYSMKHPVDSMGREISEDYIVKVRLRYFDKNEGDTLRILLKDAERLTEEAFPFVKIETGKEMVQYENIAYSMYHGIVDIIIKSADKNGMKMMPSSERGGTTSAMMVVKGLRGGPCIYSGQQAAHSVYEWVCIEDMVDMVNVTLDIVKSVADIK